MLNSRDAFRKNYLPQVSAAGKGELADRADIRRHPELRYGSIRWAVNQSARLCLQQHPIQCPEPGISFIHDNLFDIICHKCSRFDPGNRHGKVHGFKIFHFNCAIQQCGHLEVIQIRRDTKLRNPFQTAENGGSPIGLYAILKTTGLISYFIPDSYGGTSLQTPNAFLFFPQHDFNKVQILSSAGFHGFTVAHSVLVLLL